MADDASATVVEAILSVGGEQDLVTVTAVGAYPEELVKSVAQSADAA